MRQSQHLITYRQAFLFIPVWSTFEFATVQFASTILFNTEYYTLADESEKTLINSIMASQGQSAETKAQLQKIAQHREQGRQLERQLVASLYREVIQQDPASLCLYTSSTDQRLRYFTYECESLDYTRYKHDFAGVEANIFTFDIVLKGSPATDASGEQQSASIKATSSRAGSVKDDGPIKLHFHYELSNDDQVSIDSKVASINKTVVYQFTQKVDEYAVDEDDGDDDEEGDSTFATSLTGGGSKTASAKPKKAANTDKDSEISDNGRLLRKFLHKAIDLVTSLSKEQYERGKR